MHPFERLGRLHISNVWLYDAGRAGRWLVDCGHAVERRLLVGELRRRGIEPGALAGVLLTHRHSDHAGNAAFLHERWGARVHAHRADAAILSGAVARPTMPRGHGDVIASLLTEFENRLPSRTTPTEALEDGAELAGLTVFWTPGHTEGSAMFWHEASATLLTGDTLLTAIPPLVMKPGLSLPHPTFSQSVQRACESFRAFHLRGLDYRNVLPGHGPALTGDARARIDAFLRDSGVLAA